MEPISKTNSNCGFVSPGFYLLLRRISCIRLDKSVIARHHLGCVMTIESVGNGVIVALPSSRSSMYSYGIIKDVMIPQWREPDAGQGTENERGFGVGGRR